MKLCKDRHVKLSVEVLEERCAPAYLGYSEANVTIAGVNDTARVGNFQFQLQAEMYTTSDRYQAPNAQWQAVTSTPNPFQEVRSPTQPEWNLLADNYGTMGFAPSLNTLVDGSLVIRDAEAVGPSRQPAGLAAGVGQSLFVSYFPTGVDPAGDNNFHWLQFLTTNTGPFGLGGAAGTPGIDNGGSTISPFADVVSGAGDGTGFRDLPSRNVQAAPISWRADLFPVVNVQLDNGAHVFVVWQGISWGWQTGPAVARVGALNPNAGGAPGGYAVTITGDGFTGATGVSFGGVAASSFTVNSDTSITATVPSHALGTVDVTVTTPNGTSPVSSSDHFTYVSVTLSNPGDQTNLAGTSPTLTPAAFASNGDPLTFSVTGLPAGLSINTTTGKISGTIASNAGSTTPYTVTLTALDAGANVSASQSFSWRVNAPTENFTNPGDETNHAGDTIHLVLMAYASNGDPLTFSATGLQQSGLTIDATTGVISGTIASTSTAYEINVTAWDAAAGINTTIDFDWNVL